MFQCRDNFCLCFFTYCTGTCFNSIFCTGGLLCNSSFIPFMLTGCFDYFCIGASTVCTSICFNSISTAGRFFCDNSAVPTVSVSSKRFLPCIAAGLTPVIYISAAAAGRPYSAGFFGYMITTDNCINFCCNPLSVFHISYWYIIPECSARFQDRCI